MGKDFTNCVFGNLTAIRIVGSLNSHDDVWQCRCICGRFKDVSASDLVDGAVSNCGCHDDAAKMKDVSKEVSKADGPPMALHRSSGSPLELLYCFSALPR